MTLKVVRGLIGSAPQPETLKPQSSKQPEAVAQNQQAQAAVQQAAATSTAVQTSEAVVNTLRISNTKNVAGTERVKEYKEAKGIADKVSSDIRREPGSAKEVHEGLSDTDSRSHLA